MSNNAETNGQAVAAPGVITLRRADGEERTLLIGKTRPSHFLTVRQFCLKRMKLDTPLNAIREDLAGFPPEIAMKLAEKAMEAQLAGARVMDDEALSDLMLSLPGVSFLIYVHAREFAPTLTHEEVMRLAADMDPVSLLREMDHATGVAPLGNGPASRLGQPS